MRRALPIIAGCLLYVTMALYGAAHQSGTFDEFVHVTAGYSYWAFNDYRLDPESGNLAQRIVALPLVVSGAGARNFPKRDQTIWHTADVWSLADQFFFDPGHDADSLLFAARVPVAIVGALLGALVFVWARSLFGTPAGYVSFVLFVFSPTLLANGALATSDMIGAAFFVATLRTLWNTLHRVTPVTLTLSALALGGLFLAKASAPLMVPIALVMMVVALASNRPLVVQWGRERVIAARSRRAWAFAALVLVHIAVVWIAIWAAYGFRYSAFAPGSLATDTLIDPWSKILERNSGISTALAQWGRAHRILPEAYLYGYAVVVAYAKTRVGFLNGHLSINGWRSFFAFTTLYKTTIAGLILAAAGIVVLLRSLRRTDASTRVVATYELTPLLAGIAVYDGSAVLTALNIGHRHLLPVIPLAMILAGAVAAPFARASISVAKIQNTVSSSADRRSLSAAAIILLLIWHATESIAIAPHYLAYFNQLAGGPSQGYRHLVDSSLDWGQDLPGLKKWLDASGLQQRGHPPVYLSYFGTAFPSYYKIDATLLPSFADRSTPHPVPPLAPGIYCFSATMLQGGYFTRPGPWNPRYEEQYRVARRNQLLFDSTGSDSARRVALVVANGRQFWVDTFRDYEQLRTARLAAYLREREPDQQVGYSILVYRVDQEELNRALGRDGER